jgi:hypothetical protein
VSGYFDLLWGDDEIREESRERVALLVRSASSVAQCLVYIKRDAAMIEVIPLKFGVTFKRVFSDPEISSQFASDVLGFPVHVITI